MRKKIRFLTFTLCGFFLTAGLSPLQAGEDQVYRIGVALPSALESRWQTDAEAFLELDRDPAYELELIFFEYQEAQNDQIVAWVEQAFDGIIFTPVDVREVAPAVDFANQHRVPAVSYDRLAENCRPDAYVTFDRFEVGRLQGKALAAARPYGNYLLLQGPARDGNALLYYRGALSELQPLIAGGQIRVAGPYLLSDWSREAGYDAVITLAPSALPDLAAVLAPNDDVAAGAADALEELGLEPPYLISGQDATADALERIASGRQYMTVSKDAEQLARIALETCLDLIKGLGVVSSSVEANGRYEIPLVSVPVRVILNDSSN